MVKALFDTNILIDFLKGISELAEFAQLIRRGGLPPA